MKNLIATLLCLLSLTAAAQLTPTNPPASVSLAWDPSPSEGVVAYHVYWGVASRFYTNFVATTNLTLTLSNLTRGATYYFAGTAVDILGLESPFSNEVSYKVPAVPVPPTLRLSMTETKTLLVAGEPYQDYLIERSDNLLAWQPVDTARTDGAGLLAWADTNDFAAAFYRVRTL